MTSSLVQSQELMIVFATVSCWCKLALKMTETHSTDSCVQMTVLYSNCREGRIACQPSWLHIFYQAHNLLHRPILHIIFYICNITVASDVIIRFMFYLLRKIAFLQSQIPAYTFHDIGRETIHSINSLSSNKGERKVSVGHLWASNRRQTFAIGVTEKNKRSK